MAYLLFPSASTLKHNPKFIYTSKCNSALKPTFINIDSVCICTRRSKNVQLKCNAIFGNIITVPENMELDEDILHSGYMELERITGELSETQKWGYAFIAGITLIYLTARPGVLLGAIDAYLLAPLQLGLDSLSGRRSFKGSDFVIGNKLGEGSFGVVYSGILVPRNATTATTTTATVKLDNKRIQKRGQVRAVDLDGRLKNKVILKKVFFFF